MSDDLNFTLQLQASPTKCKGHSSPMHGATMGRPAAWIAFELTLGDKRRYVGAGAGDAPWLRLNPRPGSDLAAFLAAGPRPTWAALPRAVRMSHTEALALAGARQQQLRRLGYKLVRDGRRTPRGPVRSVARVWPDGRSETYRSIRAAARETGLHRSWIMRRLGRTGCRASEGIWRDVAT